MQKKNSVFIATSLDGYIADKNDGLAWLDIIPIPEGTDMGYVGFMEEVDALVMGRSTFEVVCGFDVDWPYQQPVFVLSNSLKELPVAYKDKAYLVKGELTKVLAQIHDKGYHRLYIDGGVTIQSFLKEDLIDEMTINVLPILLGGGIPLFADLPQLLEFELVESKVFLNAHVQNHYKRKR
ncbi:MAG: dihydrofolate reductase family protein [Flammeovirgaceae bacterium]